MFDKKNMKTKEKGGAVSKGIQKNDNNNLQIKMNSKPQASAFAPVALLPKIDDLTYLS